MTQRTAKPREPRESAPVGLEILATLGPVHVTDADTREIRRLVEAKTPYIDHAMFEAVAKGRQSVDAFDGIDSPEPQAGDFLRMNYAKYRAVQCLAIMTAHGITFDRICELLVWTRIALCLRNKLWAANTGLAYYVVDSMLKVAEDQRDDMLGIALRNLGFYVDRYGVEHRCKFSSYICNALRTRIRTLSIRERKRSKRTIPIIDEAHDRPQGRHRDENYREWLVDRTLAVIHRTGRDEVISAKQRRRLMDYCGFVDRDASTTLLDIGNQDGVTKAAISDSIKQARRKIIDAIEEETGERPHVCGCSGDVE